MRRAAAGAYDSAVSSSLTARTARVEDVAQMARVNVRCWQETYRGLMSDAVLDDPGFVAARERFWTAALSDERYRENRVAVAERDGELVGIAMSGPPLDPGAAWMRQLYVLCACGRPRHGCWAGAAGCGPRSGGVGGVVGGRSEPSCPGVLSQARLCCRRDNPGRGRGAGDPHGPRHAAQSIIQFRGRALGRRRRLDGPQRGPRTSLADPHAEPHFSMPAFYHSWFVQVSVCDSLIKGGYRCWINRR